MAHLRTLVILAMLATTCTASTRRLLGDEKKQEQQQKEQKAEVEKVNKLFAIDPKATSGQLAPELVPLFQSLQNSDALQAAALRCSEATGIKDIAAELGATMLGAVAAFKQYGFCALDTQEEQAARLTYMASYATSMQLKSLFLSEYACEGVAALPEECFIGALVGDAVDAAFKAYRGDVACTDVSTDGTKAVGLLTLPADWKPTAAPKYKCAPRVAVPPAATAAAASVASASTATTATAQPSP